MDTSEKGVYQTAYCCVDEESKKIVSFRITKGNIYMIQKSSVN